MNKQASTSYFVYFCFFFLLAIPFVCELRRFQHQQPLQAPKSLAWLGPACQPALWATGQNRAATHLFHVLVSTGVSQVLYFCLTQKTWPEFTLWDIWLQVVLLFAFLVTAYAIVCNCASLQLGSKWKVYYLHWSSVEWHHSHTCHFCWIRLHSFHWVLIINSTLLSVLIFGCASNKFLDPLPIYCSSCS